MDQEEEEAMNSPTVRETKSLIFDSKTLTFSLATSSSRTSNATAPVINLPVITGKKTLPKALQPRTVNQSALSTGYKPVFSGFPGLGAYPKNPTQSSSSSLPQRRSSLSTHNTYATPQCNFSRPSTARNSSTFSEKPSREGDSIKENESSRQNSQYVPANRLIEAEKSRTLESRPVVNRRHSAVQRSSIDSESIFNRISGAFDRKTPLQEEKSSEEAIFRNLGRLAKRNSMPMKAFEISVDQDDQQTSRAFISFNPSERHKAKPHSGPIDSTNLDFSWSTYFGKNNKISEEPNLSDLKENEISFSVSSDVSTSRSKNQSNLTNQNESGDKQPSQAALQNDFHSEAWPETSTDIREIDPRPEEIMIVQRRQLQVVYGEAQTCERNRSISSVHDKWDDDCIPVSPRHTLKSPTNNKFSLLNDPSHDQTTATKIQPATPPPSPTTTTPSSSSPPPPTVTTDDEKVNQPNGESTLEIVDDDVFKKTEADRNQASLSCSNGEEICESTECFSPPPLPSSCPPPLPSSCPPSSSLENFENTLTGEEEIHGKVSSVSTVENSKAHRESFPKSDNEEDFMIRKFTETGLESFICTEKIEELSDQTLTFLDLSSHPQGQNFGSEDSGCDQSSVCDNNHSLEDPTSYQEVHVEASQNGSAEVNEIKKDEKEEECSQFESRISYKENPSNDQDISSFAEASRKIIEVKERLIAEPTTATENSVGEVNRSNLVGEKDVVEIDKGFLGVGFCIEGGIGSPTGDKPILIKRVVRVDVPLNVGDELVSLNGESVSAMSCSQVWRKLKSLPDGIMTLELKKKRLSK